MGSGGRGWGNEGRIPSGLILYLYSITSVYIDLRRSLMKLCGPDLDQSEFPLRFEEIPNPTTALHPFNSIYISLDLPRSKTRIHYGHKNSNDIKKIEQKTVCTLTHVQPHSPAHM